MSVVIIGAGMAGLLAARMLGRRGPVVVESQPLLPSNHSAVLRFRSNIVSEVTGIPFRRVQVVKSVIRWRNPVADSLAYSEKCLGVRRTDRSILRGDEVVERWIAPPDFIARLAEGVEVQYGTAYDFPPWGEDADSTVSTIPMPSLMDALAYPLPHPDFSWVPGVNVRAKIKRCDAYVSLAVPSPEYSFSRVSVTGDELIVEFPGASESYLKDHPQEVRDVLGEAIAMLGIDWVDSIEVREQKYAKIAPVDEEERRKFIFWASTIKGRAFSLGRFATWRPGLLLDDLVKDVRVIERLMDSPYMRYDAQMKELVRP